VGIVDDEPHAETIPVVITTTVNSFLAVIRAIDRCLSGI
jgi:hypothetical protein